MKFIYFAQMPGGGPIKIGSTKNLHFRLNSLRKEFGDRLQIVMSVAGRMVDELTLHHIFHEDRIVGEWFFDSAKLTAFIEMLAKIGELPEPYRWREPPKRETKSCPRRGKCGPRPKMSAAMRARAAALAPAKTAARCMLRNRLHAAAL